MRADEPGSEALDRIAPGAPAPLLRLEVRLDLGRGERAERHRRSSLLDDREAVAEEAEARDAPGACGRRARPAWRARRRGRPPCRRGGRRGGRSCRRRASTAPSACTDRALPSAWSRTSVTGSASGGSCSTYDGATAVNGIRSCSRIARRCGDVEARTSALGREQAATEVPPELGLVAPAERGRVRDEPVVEAVVGPAPRSAETSSPAIRLSSSSRVSTTSRTSRPKTA